MRSIQISGGAASAIVSGTRNKSPRRAAVYGIAGLGVVTILGLLGWQLLGGGAVQDANEMGAADPTPTESQAAEESLPVPTPTPGFEAVMNASLIASEEIITLDPHLADGAALVLMKDLFFSLTRFNTETAEVVPAAAASWSISPDGTIYTFTLHPDIPWVQHALGGETVQMEDEDGNPHFLTAQDFEYAFKRICTPG